MYKNDFMFNWTIFEKVKRLIEINYYLLLFIIQIHIIFCLEIIVSKLRNKSSHQSCSFNKLIIKYLDGYI